MRVRYGKPIKVKSLTSKQNIFSSTSGLVNHVCFNKDNSFSYGSALPFNSEAKHINIVNGHKYFCFVKLNFTPTGTTRFIMYKGDGTVDGALSSGSCDINDYYHCALINVTYNNPDAHLNFYLNTRQNFNTIYFGGCIDLTEIGLDNLTAQEFYNKYNQYFPLIATGEEITIDDKAGQVSYDKKVILQSLWGDQSNLTAVQPSVSGNYIYLGKNGYSTQSTYNINTNLEDFNTAITSGHKYILVLYQNGSAAYHMVPQPNGDKWRWTTSGTYIAGQLNYSYYVADANIILKNFYQGGSGTPILYKDFFIDLTDTFGAGNEPTAQEFYNKYKGYFLALTKGEKVIAGKGKIAGGSSDIYYGYNSIVSLERSGNVIGGTLDYDDSTNIFTYTFGETVGHTNWNHYMCFIMTNSGYDETHQYMSFVKIKHSKKLRVYNYPLTTFDVNQNGSDDWQIVSGIRTGARYGMGSLFYFQFIECDTNGWLPGESFQFMPITTIDLTDWFGTGKEPSTYDEFKEKFTKEYYGFCPTPIKLTRYQIEALPTYGYNQLQVNGMNNYRTFASEQGKATRTYDSETNTLMLDFTDNYPTGQFYYNNDSVLFRQGDKGLFICQVNSNKVVQIGTFYAFDPSYQRTNGSIANEWSEVYKFGTFQSGYAGKNPYWYVYSSSSFVNGDYVYVRNFMLINLTDWYGAGSEPTTIEEFKATFPNLYYPYSKKRLLNKYMINKLSAN